MKHIGFGAGLLAALLVTACGGGGGGGAPAADVVTPPGFGDTTLTPTEVYSGLISPQFMTFNNGFLYVADRTVSSSNATGTIRKINPSNQAMTALGTINSPVGVAFDSSGYLYATGGNPNSGTGLLLVNTGNGSLTDKVLGLNPAGVAFDGSGYGYVADLSGKVVVLDSGFSQVGQGVSISSSPNGVVFTGGNAYVTRYGGGNQGVYKFQTPTNAASLFASSTYFNNPTAIAVRTNPLQFYVVNTGGAYSERSILKISADGSSVTTFLSATTQAHKLCAPTGIAIDGNDFYFANSSCSGFTNSSYAGKIFKVTLP